MLGIPRMLADARHSALRCCFASLRNKLRAPCLRDANPSALVALHRRHGCWGVAARYLRNIIFFAGKKNYITHFGIVAEYFVHALMSRSSASRRILRAEVRRPK
jgi:hypothetical protein